MMKMKLASGLTVFLLFSVAQADTKPKYGPSGAPRATSVATSNEYFRSAKHQAPDFWALTGYYVPQFNEYACSAASVTMVLNAARAKLPKSSDDTVITQKALLDKVSAEQWKQRLSAEGADGEHGTTLDQLAKVTEAAFRAYGFNKVSVQTFHVENTSAAAKQKLVNDLARNEKSATDFIIANFNQQAYTDDADAGHIAPVGAYDADKGRVLVFDPDRDYYEPYWVSVDHFLAGMATKDKGADAYRGYIVVSVGK